MGLLATALLFAPGLSSGQNLLDGPQKLVIDEAHNRLLVSNYYSTDIIQIDEYSVQDTFVAGAGFIDGVAIIGNTVYGVGSGRYIYGYDLDTRLQTFSAHIGGIGYLSSITADNSGHLFISCPNQNKIYKMRVSDGVWWVFEDSGALVKPNGMLFQESEGRLLVVEDKRNPKVHAISLSDTTVTTLVSTTLAGADGIEQDQFGNYYIAGYYLPGVYKFDSAFSNPPEMIYEGDGIVYPTYDASDNSLLVTCWIPSSWIRIPLTSTGIIDPRHEAGSFRLGRAFPNPLRSTTSISFSLDRPQPVAISVHDLSGRLVATLTDRSYGPGTHLVQWDGKTSSRRDASSGTYFVRMRTAEGGQTKCVRLVR